MSERKRDAALEALYCLAGSISASRRVSRNLQYFVENMPERPFAVNTVDVPDAAKKVFKAQAGRLGFLVVPGGQTPLYVFSPTAFMDRLQRKLGQEGFLPDGAVKRGLLECIQKYDAEK